MCDDWEEKSRGTLKNESRTRFEVGCGPVGGFAALGYDSSRPRS